MSEPADLPTPEVEPTGRPNARLRQTIRDMILSMAVVLAVVFVIVLLAWRPLPEAVKVVPTATVVAQAGQEATFDLVAPRDLAEGWRATSARWQPTEDSGDEPVLHIGYVTPSDEYAQFSTAAVVDARFLDEQTAGGTPTGSQGVDDVTWERWETPERRSLVLRMDDRVVVVSGTAPWEELVTLAQSLAPVTSP